MVLNRNYFKLPNDIFFDGLSTDEIAVYAYLVSLAGANDYAYPSESRIAACVNRSKNTVRKALNNLAERGFIEIRHSYQEIPGKNKRRQANNHYHIKELPFRYYQKPEKPEFVEEPVEDLPF